MAVRCGIGAKREHTTKEADQRLRVTTSKARNRDVIGLQAANGNPESHILAAPALDRPARALPDRVRVQQQRRHQARLIRGPALTVVAILRLETREASRSTASQIAHTK
jgi:hypothetical protein